MDALIESVSELAGGGGYRPWIIAVLIIVATAIVESLVVRVIRRLTQVDGSPLPESSILVNIVRAVIWILGISIMLSACFDVDVNGLIAALGVGGVALSLGTQDTVKNFIGGLQVTVMKIVQPGDQISVNGVEGIVHDVSWRQTVVKDFENRVHLIPNAVINSSTVTKINPGSLVVTRISFVNDGRDLDEMIFEMEQLARRAVEKVAELEKDPWILMTEIGEYGMWGKLRFVLKDTEHAREARDAALRALAPYTRLNPEDVLLDNGEED